MKRIPEKTDLFSTVLVEFVDFPGSPEERIDAVAYTIAQTEYGTCAPKAYRRPPAAGPTMNAALFVSEDKARAAGTSGNSTRLGTRACVEGISNARADAKTAMIT